MSNAVFPTFAGLTYDNVVAPQFNTKIHRAVSGYEVRAAYMAYPLWTFKLKYELLRDDVVYNELDTLLGFFNARQGSFDSFLYSNPADNAVITQQFGIGNGTQTQYQLTRPLGGYIEPVQNLNGAPVIYKTTAIFGRQIQYVTPRTNLFVLSEEMNYVALETLGDVFTRNTGISVSGTLNADAFLIGTTNSFHRIRPAGNAAYSAGTPYTRTYYLRPLAGQRYLQILEWSAANSFNLNCDLQSGVIVSAGNGAGTGFLSASISPVPGLVGVFQISLSFVPQVSAIFQPMVYCFSSTNAQNWSGTGFEGVEFCGIQLEASSLASPYIKTGVVAVTTTDYTLSNTGLVSFAAAPAAGEVLDWTGGYYYRCRFLADSIDPTQFMANLYSLAKLEFIGSPMNKV